MKECTPLSASRIKTAQGCSWSYWSNYHLKIPDSGNDGANRGWICHLVFELLGNPRHRKIYDEIILRDSIFLSPPVSRLVGYHARRLGVNDKENLELINRMTLAGLHFDFFGANRVAPDEAISEQDFNITVSEGEKLYRVRGYIDKLFLYKKDSVAVIRDFKSSKAVFKGKDITDNLQDLIYTLAVKKLFPHFKSRQVEFLFLKFDLNSTGCIKMKELSPEELEGLELQLTQIQKYIDGFDEYDAVSNFAANQYSDNRGYPPDGSFGGLLACGKDGYKIHKKKPLLDKDGNKVPAYICPYRKPLEYYVVKDKSGKIIKSASKDKKKSISPDSSQGETLELFKYGGCPHWNKKRENSDNFFD